MTYIEYMLDEEYCPRREDETHCECWWDGDACCSCGASGLTDVEKRENGMIS